MHLLVRCRSARRGRGQRFRSRLNIGTYPQPQDLWALAIHIWCVMANACNVRFSSPSRSLASVAAPSSGAQLRWRRKIAMISESQRPYIKKGGEGLAWRIVELDHPWGGKWLAESPALFQPPRVGSNRIGNWCKLLFKIKLKRSPNS